LPATSHEGDLGQPRSLLGSVTFNVSDDELIEPIDVDWDAVH
jgi:hypothetical protein